MHFVPLNLIESVRSPLPGARGIKYDVLDFAFIGVAAGFGTTFLFFKSVGSADAGNKVGNIAGRLRLTCFDA